MMGTKPIEIVSKPVQIDIMQPALPRPVELTAPTWYVVSEAKITNPCRKSISFEPKKFNDEGVELLKRPKTCELSERDNPDWPEGYTYFDRFLDDMKKQNNGEVVFVATTIGDYEVMAEDMQEIKRYIKQMGEVIVYYREVTLPNGQKGVGAQIERNDNKAISKLNPIQFGKKDE
jgi:hypothetical protein